MSEVKVSGEKRMAISIAILAVLLIAWVGFHQISQLMGPVDAGNEERIEVTIPAQCTTSQVARILYEHNLIQNEKFFVGYCRVKGLDQNLKAGVYSFNRAQSLSELVEGLVQGKVVTVGFTVPEGYTLSQIGELLVKENICTAEEWQQALIQDYDYEFLKKAPDTENHLEGFLFPATYRVARDVTAQQVVDMMLKRFEQEWKGGLAATAREQGRDVYEVVTLASLIEKEARVDEERPVIAGVLINRLKKGMPLQVDATVLYSLGEHKPVVTYRDLEVDSPYNTYRYPGLPLGPIASPGSASLAAALQPAQHSYYYYVYMGDGRHYFSKTHDEHVQAKQKYLKNRS